MWSPGTGPPPSVASRPDQRRRPTSSPSPERGRRPRRSSALLRRGLDRDPRNLNNRIGLPAMAFVAGPEHRFLVLEAGMSLRGEMTELAGISEPDVVVVTNVGVAHAEGVGGTRADVAREKAALVEALGPTGVAVINADDDAAMATLARTRAGRAVTFGRSEFADYRLLDRIPIGTEGSRVTFERPCVDCASPGARETLEAELPIVGEVAALDFLAALAAAEATAGTFEKERIDTGLAKNLALSGRASIVPLADGSILVDDAYNANPGSMRAAVRTLVELAKGKGTRAIAVLGEMKELGALADAEHDALGDVLAEAGVALVVGAGGLADRTLVRAASRGTPVIHAKDSQEAARLVLPEVHPGDVVLVKASRSVAAEVVVNALVAARGLRGAGDAA
ncbi:MAG: Mur ligase family protein [Polyangiaceae bacterium]